MTGGGIYGTWQPVYAEAGLAAFPVDPIAKKPMVSNYDRVGVRACNKFAQRFRDAPALGVWCKRAGLTILDVDTTDERVLADGLAEYGETPIVIRSGSGHYQAWYRNGGEPRKIKPDKSKPIDILGGGFVVAPPSHGAKGDYEFLSGSLADLSSLPLMRKPSLAPEPANDSELAIGQTVEPLAAAVGERNEALLREALRAAQRCGGLEALLEHVGRVNAGFAPPLPHSEAVKVAHNAWRIQIEGRNKFGQEQRVELTASEIDALWHAPDAIPLLICLRRHHWERPRFFVANEMAKVMPGGGWHRVRFTAARSALEASGLIVMVERSRRTTPAVYRFGGI